ncbi:hypothetical protein KC338_g61 [Hortaea werneckii]|nr:hypothetical protein KC338_g61 [Hortaea werneckii]
MSSLPLSSPKLASHTLRRDHEHQLCEGDWFQSLIYCFHRAVRAVLEQPIKKLWIVSRLGAMRLANVDSQTSNTSSIDQRRFAPGSPASAADQGISTVAKAARELHVEVIGRIRSRITATFGTFDEDIAVAIQNDTWEA